MDDTTVKPFDGQRGLERKQLAKYLNRVGRGVNCRMDVPILTIEDIKWAATVFERLSKDLSQLAFVDDRSDIWRILGARYEMENARAELAFRNAKKASEKAAKDAQKRAR